MQVLINDSDDSLHRYYETLLTTSFPEVTITYAYKSDEILNLVEKGQVDLMISDVLVDGMNFFELLQILIKRHVPVVIVSSRESNRIAVECIRNGAMDYIPRKKLYKGHLLELIKRSLLDVDRLQKVFQFMESIPVRPEYVTVNRQILTRAEKRILRTEDPVFDSIEQTRISEEDELQEGNNYRFIFIYLQLHLPETLKNAMNLESYTQTKNLILSKMGEMPSKYGGKLWVKKEDALVFAFQSESSIPATLAAVELKSSMNIINVTVPNLQEPIAMNIGMDSGHAVYREHKGDIISEALNLSAHIAFNHPIENRIIITDRVFTNLSPRAMRYFSKYEDLFEGNHIYYFHLLD